jgi:two-component system, cell cycle sensor histidine kinase and response regulator CckA
MQLSEDLNKQILVVEDEGLIAADIQKKLERLGYPIPAIASSGEEALKCARSTWFDLVLMDISLKGAMDGIATAQTLKAELEMPVVYVTAHADKATVDRAKVTEPLGYILKPITDGDLRSTVRISLHKHEMERRLRANEAWLSTTLRSVGEGIIATNNGGEIVFLNPVAEQLTGWSSSDAYGCLLMDVLGLFDESQGQPAKNPVFDRIAGENASYSLISRTGTRTPVEVQCFENRSADRLLGSILVMRDITGRRQLEGRLIQSQTMAAIAHMAGGLAQEFNNQLTVIVRCADELCARTSGKTKGLALEIKQAATIASAITGHLVTLSHREAVRPETVDVNEAICEAQPLISFSLGKARTLTTDLGSPGGLIRGDRNQIKQILLNLALHARDALPADGGLRIESSTLEITGESPSARLYRPGPYVRLLVASTGKEMDPAAPPHIFEPFFTNNNAGTGTGLGMSVVHAIVVQSGGYINAAHDSAKGTTFEILLPCIGSRK